MYNANDYYNTVFKLNLKCQTFCGNNFEVDSLVESTRVDLIINTNKLSPHQLII